MPNTRNTERVVVVRTDPDGNVLGYEVVEQPIQSSVVEKPVRSPVIEKRARSPVILKPIWSGTVEKPVRSPVIEKRARSPVILKPIRSGTVEKPVRSPVIEKRARSPVILKPIWSGTVEKPVRSPVIEKRARSPVILKPIRSATVEKPVRSTVFQKSTPINRSRSYSQSPKDNWKKTYEEEKDNDVYDDDESKANSTIVLTPYKKSRRDTSSRGKRKPRRVRYVPLKSNVTIFDEKVDWNANTKIDTHNDNAIRRIQRAAQSVIFREKLDWRAQPRTDTNNEAAIENLRRMRSKRPIRDEKLEWKSTRRINDHNEQYIKYKEQAQILRKEKTFVQDLPQEWKPRDDRIRVDHHNPEYEEHKKRQQSAKLPPIEDRKIEWKKKSRINQKIDDYIERLRQKRSIPIIFKEKLRWNTKTPKINAYNEGYVENLKDRPRSTVHIHNRLPRWKSQTKIDTGLEPESEEEESDENDSTA